MKKIPVFLDFDGVLFQDAGLKKELAIIFQHLGFSETMIADEYARYRNLYAIFDPETFLDHFGCSPQQRDQFHVRWDQVLADLRPLLFPRTLPFLEELDRRHFSPQILTYGLPSFQRRKVESCGLHDLCDQCHYVTGSKADYVQQTLGLAPETFFYFIDDQPRHREAMAAAFPNSINLSELPVGTLQSAPSAALD